MATAQQIASPGVYVSDDVGLEVTDGSNSRVQLGLLPTGTYGLRVVTAGGSTVIIDGTSDMFKIAATGTLQTASFVMAPAGSSASASVTLSTGLTYPPAYLGFFEGTAGIVDHMTDYYVMDFTVANAAAVLDGYGLHTELSGTNQTLVSAGTTSSRNSGSTQPARNYRYYVIEETAI